jgi:2-polyprenyl-3-methyl-5-hydroxy-6-metoxy-1,4-benzoquinol methylase
MVVEKNYAKGCKGWDLCFLLTWGIIIINSPLKCIMDKKKYFFIREFVIPLSLAQKDDTSGIDSGLTYTDRNYHQGIAAYFRRIHFETALRLTSNYPQSINVIDYGCADGPFLPSLSRYFNKVVGIDRDKEYLKIASRCIEKMHLPNVQLVHIENIKPSEPVVPLEQLKSPLTTEEFTILFLLESLEHIGDPENVYNSQMRFLKELFCLLSTEGIIVISVPKMFGLSYFFQTVGLKILGQNLEYSCHSTKDLIKASLWIDTGSIEKQWTGYHLGYNYKKLEAALKQNFEIINKKDIFFQVVYVIRQK